ncbi:MAG: hypothetical protein CMJ89_05610 [Planctomycetes bacterium]|nr:hypothetical protein [Planctomycetota bacterium]
MSFLSRTHTLRSWLGTRPWHGLSGSRLLRLFAWGVLGGALEVLGRTSPNEWIDALGVLGIVLGVAITLGRQDETSRKAWGRRITRSLNRRFASWKLRSGLDLRGNPPLSPRHPWRYAVLAGAIFLFLSTLLATHSFWPSGARSTLQNVSGLLYLVLLTGLWTALGLGTLTLWIASFAALEERLARSLTKHRWLEGRRSMYATLGFAAFIFVSLAGSFLPAVIPLVVVCISLILYACAVYAPGQSLRMTWKYADQNGEPYTSRWVWWDITLISGLGMLLSVPIVLSMGDRLGSTPFAGTSISGFLGGSFAWSLALFTPGCLGYVASRLLVAWRADPARPVPVCVHVQAHLTPKQSQAIASQLEQAGFATTFGPAAPKSTEVPILLEEDVAAGDKFSSFFTPWPRRVSSADIASEELHASLRRRAHLQYRRLLLRRLKNILKHARRRKYERGEGFWIAPQFWFATHLTRDTDEDSGTAIGPPYRKAIPREALHHLFKVMRAVDIDLVFLEDGVTLPSFRRVMSAVFEHYDLFADRQLEDGRHFSGIPGVRVLIHEFQLEQPLKPTGYPEPDYEDLGRARILHIYRDRGDDEAKEDVPIDLSSLPVPVGSFGGPLSLF